MLKDNSEQEKDNQKIEDSNESALENIRAGIEKTSKEEDMRKDDEDEENKETLKKFHERIEKNAEKFEGVKAEEFVNFVRDEISNLKVCEGAREGFAEVVSDAIIEVLTKAETDKLELDNIENIIDIGGGYGDNLKATITKIKKMREGDNKINGVCLDRKTSLSKKVESDKEIKGSYQDANETSFEDNSFELVMATHLLQEIKGIKNKKNILQEMKRISKGRIVLIVEEKRNGVNALKDNINHFVNNFNTKFDVLGKDEYKKLFERLELTIEAEVESESNEMTYLLKFDKEKVE